MGLIEKMADLGKRVEECDRRFITLSFLGKTPSPYPVVQGIMFVRVTQKRTDPHRPVLFIHIHNICLSIRSQILT